MRSQHRLVDLLGAVGGHGERWAEGFGGGEGD
jgi:hypothetical protein